MFEAINWVKDAIQIQIMMKLILVYFRGMGVNLNFSLICPLLFILGFKCPVCSKSVASNEMEVHFIMCLSKPRLSYNGKVLCLPVLFMTGGYCRSGTWKEKPGSPVCQQIINRLWPCFFKIMSFSIFIGLPSNAPSLLLLLLCG